MTEKGGGNFQSLYLGLAETYLKELRAVFGERLYSACLFGSVARGTATPESDIDLLVVVADLPRDVGSRHRMMNKARMRTMGTHAYKELRSKGRSTTISEIYLTPEEVKGHPPILLDVAFDGIILHDKEDFLGKVLQEIKDRLRVLSARKVETKKGWYWVLRPDAKIGEEVRI